MRGAYSNGVLSAFEEAGLTSWRAIYGTSAGGALAAWFAAGQARYAEETWRYAVDPRILSYRRALLGGPILDHEALLAIVYEKEHPIDQEAIRRYRAPVTVTASDVDAGQPHYQDLRAGPVIPWLKATGRLPLGAGPPVSIGGRRFLDGGILDPIPLRRAIADGATDITLVLNKPTGPPASESAVLASLLARRYPSLREGLARHQAMKREAVELALDPPEGVTVQVIRPSGPTGLHRLSRDMDRIRAAIELGRRDGRKAMDAA